MTTTTTPTAVGRAGPWRGVIEEFRDRLPVPDDATVVTLLEGGTPLVPAPALSARTGCDVWLKVEGANPTGSFKDRGMTMAITMAKHAGAEAVLCASTGNTSASAAAYAARAGLTCGVLVPRGRIAVGKLAQAVVHGAQLLQVDGSFDDCLVVARKLAADYPIVLVNSVNPHRIEGQKTIAFEIVDALGDSPDLHCLPVGNAGNITAHWQGYREARAAGSSSRLPRMYGVQAEGAAPFVTGAPVADPQTVASAIRIGAPASWDQAIRARDESGGRDRGGERRGDSRGVPLAGRERRRLRRAGVGGERRRAPATRCREQAHGWSARGLHGDRPWPQGHRVGGRRDA